MIRVLFKLFLSEMAPPEFAFAIATGVGNAVVVLTTNTAPGSAAESGGVAVIPLSLSAHNFMECNIIYAICFEILLALVVVICRFIYAYIHTSTYMRDYELVLNIRSIPIVK